MRGDKLPTREDVEAMRAYWTGPGSFDPPGDERVRRTHSDGRIVVQAPNAETAHELGESARRHEEMHGEGREGVLLAMAEAPARGVAAGPGPWAIRNCTTEKGREDLRRAGFEERHDKRFGTVWVRPADGETLKARELGFVVPVEEDERRRSG